MKTVKQIADEIGVSKQAVQKRIAREPLKSRLYPSIDTKNGTKYIAEDGEKLIIEAFSAKPATASIPVSIPTDTVASIDGDTHVHTLITTLQEQLAVKDRQIEAQEKQLEARDKQIGELTATLEHVSASLHAAQALHAGTMQQQLEACAEEPEASPISAEPPGAEEPGPADLEPQPGESAQAAAELEQPRPRWSWWPFGRKL